MKKKKLVIILPALNEEKTIGEVLGSIPSIIHGIDMIETLVIDDGSTDQTRNVAEAAGASVSGFPCHQGLGLVFRKGIELALEKQADIIVNIDADGQFNAEDIPKLVAPIVEGRADFVTASRFLSRKNRPKMPMIKFIGNKLMSLIVSWIVGSRFFDVSCGFRAYSRDAALRLNLFGHYTYTQESFIDLAYKGMSILEVPVSVRGEREHGKSKVASNLFKYGYHTMKIIIMAFRDYKPLRLMSFFSFISILISISMGFFFLQYYIRTGSFRPHTWAAVGSGTMMLLSLFILAVGVIMEMFSRMRLNQEKILYFIKKDFYDHKDIDGLTE